MIQALLVLLLVAQPEMPGPGQPYVTIPATVTGQVGAFITIPSTTNGKTVLWLSIDAGLNVFPTEFLRDSRTAIVTSSSAGQYRILALTALADVPAKSNECMVVVGQPAPPVPPVPPTPPVPDLQRRLQAAYDLDTDTDKRDAAAILAAIYRKAGPGMDVVAVKTVGELDGWVRDASFLALGGLRVPRLRDAVGKYLAGQLPRRAGDAIDAGTRERFKAVCLALSSAIDGLR